MDPCEDPLGTDIKEEAVDALIKVEEKEEPFDYETRASLPPSSPQQASDSARSVVSCLLLLNSYRSSIISISFVIISMGHYF